MTKMNNDSFNKANGCLLACLFIGLQLPMWGQAEGFKMGLALDPNVAWMNSRDFEHTTEGLRAHFGYQFMADILFTETYAFGTGLHVFRTGSQVNYLEQVNDSTVQRVQQDLNNQYVELPLTFKMRTKEIGYTTYYGKFGAGVGLNTRREADEVRTSAFERNEGVWATVNDPVVPAPDAVANQEVSLFRASMIVGLGFERRIAGNTAIMVGLTFNNSLFSTHGDQTVVRVDANGNPQGLNDGLILTERMQGQDSFLALTVGLVF
ncbi:MAG: hypothetical protein RLZZ314_443 [Bacteroidota bacterium]|jgi:hypothetical protein